MAQAGQTPIQLYYSNTAGAAPTSANLIIGEVAINVNDGLMFYEDSTGTVNTIASAAVTKGFNQKIVFTGDNTTQTTAAAPWNYSNASFLLANSANNLAQTGYDQANAGTNLATSGYLHANNAFNKANAANNLATSAYAKANAGVISASSGYDRANDANILAQAGFNKANDVNTFTSSGYNKANAANNLAQSAYNKANAAMTVGTTNTAGDTIGTILNVHTLRFDEDSGFAVTEMATGVAKVAINSTFKYWEVDGQSTIIAQGLDTIKFVPTGGLAITTQPNDPKSITFDVSVVHNKANTVESFAVASYDKANAVGEFANAAYAKGNTVGISSNAAFNKANTAYDLALYIQDVNNYQNNFLGTTSSLGAYAYDQANAATESAQFAYDKANSGYDIAVVATDVNNAQNTRITAVDTFAGSSFTRANGASALAQASFHRANGAPFAYNTANASYDQANAATDSAQSGFHVANAAFEQANVTIYLQGVNDSQNTSLTAINNFAASGYTKANSGNILAQSAYTRANAADALATSSYAHANDVNIFAGAGYTQANDATTSAQSAYNHANNAYDRANTKFNSTGGYITGYANVSSNVSVGTHIDLNTSSKPTNREGRFFYDVDQKALAYYNESDMTLQIGQESVVRVWNNTGSTITDGKAVRITGASSANGFPSVALGSASTYDLSEVIGITTTVIPNGGYGYVTQQGKINGLNTAIYTEGQEVYLTSDGTGGFQAGAPADPNIAVRLGVISKVDGVSGSLLVDISFREGVNKTTGAVIFAYDEALHQDPSNFFYDHVNKRLGIGTDTPQANLHVVGDAIFSSNVTITGNLSISNAQSISTSELTVGGNTIILNSDATGTPTTNASIIVNRGSSVNTYMMWDESIDEWIMYDGVGTPGHIIHSEKTAKTWDEYAAMPAYEKLSHPIGASLANTTNEHARGAYATANSALLVATDLSYLTPAAYNQANATNTLATSGYSKANAADTLATSSYTQANATNNLAQTGFTKANAATNSAQSGYNQANAATQSAQAAYDVANVTIQLQFTNDVQNTAITALDEYSQSGYGFANTLSNYAGASYGKANAVGTFAVASFTKANSATQSAQAAYDKANTAYDYAAYGAEVNLSQNTNIGYVDTYATSGYSQANAANDLATSAYGSSNTNATAITLIQSVNAYQNTLVVAANNLATSAYAQANAVIKLQTVNDEQNTTITAVSNYSVSGYALANAANNLASAAFEAANTGTTAAAAFEQANASNTLAVSAYAQANATNEYATAAFLAANTGSMGQLAYTQANAATESASWAYYKANSVDVLASASYEQANTATIYGLGGQSLAQAAYNKANSIVGGTFTAYLYTVSNTAPSSPTVGDKWWDSDTDILYEFIDDGQGQVWVDIDTPTLSTQNNTITVNNTYTGYGRSAAMAIVFGGF